MAVYIPYNNVPEIWQTSGTISPGAKCNGILFVNSGDTPINILGITLYPNASLPAVGNVGEVDTSTYPFNFIAPVGTNPQLTVIRKIYNQ